MDSELDSIWDQPVLETPQKRPSQPPDDTNDDRDATHDAQRPSKRPRQALFLSDSDEDMVDAGTSRPRAAASAPPMNAELDALFADSDDEALRPLPGRIDEAALTRQAEARVRREMPSLTPYQVMPSSSPQRDTGSPSGNRNNKSGKGDTEKKERRRVVKLDEARLLNQNNGFPQLINMTRDFKIKGKGHEATDLNRLLQKYQYWTHQLYPKLQFQDTVERVEKLCHSRRMTVALSVWRDEFHGRTGERQVLDIDDEEEDTGAIDDEHQVARTHSMDTHGMDTDRTSSRPSRSSPSLPSSRASSPPATSGAESSRGGVNASRGPATSEPEPDEDEDFWKSLDDFGGNAMDARAPAPPPKVTKASVPVPAAVPQPATNAGEEDDFWNSFDDFGGDVIDARAPPPPPKVTSAPAPSFDDIDDEDMWDIVNEVEKEASKNQPQASSGQVPSSAPKVPSVPASEPEYADPSEWDDMYV